MAVPRYIDLEANARTRAVEAAVSELNGRESLTWADVKISTSGYSLIGDAGVFSRMLDGNPYINLGDDYPWTGDQTLITGGEFSFRGEAFTVSRKPSTTSTPGSWSIK